MISVNSKVRLDWSVQKEPIARCAYNLVNYQTHAWESAYCDLEAFLDVPSKNNGKSQKF